MTKHTRIRNLILLAHRGSDESEGVAPDVHIRDRLLNARHMAVDALTAGAGRLVVRMLFERAVRTVGRIRPVTLQT